MCISLYLFESERLSPKQFQNIYCCIHLHVLLPIFAPEFLRGETTFIFINKNCKQNNTKVDGPVS